ncbi:hypothetical protein PILCRDRAFT_827178 [Piloderma croceum F 1598]|uniref:ERCC1-like central domain-containing protein n=1 Tax=Piloderma croceum (strain F 1598) TaxID=765440 RepID=A0A0C3F643_PILCF|nr:hypothetical protein PILCRDRAFT_827178 [Piloderma croceum F 1598]
MSASTNKPSAGPKPPVVLPGGTGNNIIINSNQRLNPLLECIRNVGKEFGDIVPDFQVGRTTCVLYLSLKYHRLHPEYIHQRIERLGHSYSLRILLLLCDVSEHQDPIRELTKICLINNITVMVAWTVDEAGLYLSTFKQYEHKPPDLIKERVDKDYNSVLRTSLTSISRVNKTDVETLRTSLGSFADIAKTPADRLQALPGFGQVKVKKIKDAFEKPFRNHATSTLLSTYNTASASTVVCDTDGKGKGKEKATSQPESSTTTRIRPPREPSPVWDIELDLDRDININSPESGPPPVTRPPEKGPNSKDNGEVKRARSPSPIWDIELDLNGSDEEDNQDGKGKGKARFGAAELL